MAGIDLPDTLTPEQAAKLGLIPPANPGKAELPDTLTPEEAKRLGFAAAGSPEPEAPPGVFERIGTGFARMGQTIGAGAKAAFGHSPLIAAIGAPEGERLGAAGHAFVDSLKDVTDPARRKEVLRGYDNMVTLGHGQRLAARVGNALGDIGTGHTLNETRQFSPGLFAGSTGGPSQVEAAERAAAPGYQELGTLLGVGSPGVANTIGKGAGKVVQIATGAAKPASTVLRAGLGAGRAVAGYEASAPLIAGLSADAEGDRFKAAKEAATDPASIILAGTTGAGSGAFQRLAETAPARVAKRQAKDITTGEANAGKRITQRVQERAGEGGDRLAVVLAEDPKLEKLIAVKAGTSPEKVGKAVTSKVGEINDELDGIYRDMEKSGRVVSPTDIAVSFDKLLGDRLAAGQIDAVNILRRARAQFLNEYGNYGHLSADALRGLKATARTAAFAGDPAAPPKLKAQINRDIWAVYSDAIEQQAKSAKGVDVGRLRKLNQDVSVLIPVEQALTERGQMEAAGRHSIGSHIARSALGAAGFAHGGVKEAVVGLVAPEAAKLAGEGLRRVDYRLAKKFKGIAPDNAGAKGGRVGSLDYAARVANGMGNGMSLREAVDSADEGD